MNLEKEFQREKIKHQKAVLGNKIIKYYMDRHITQLDEIPKFLYREAYKTKAMFDVENLYNNDRKEFERLYNIAWEEEKHNID